MSAFDLDIRSSVAAALQERRPVVAIVTSPLAQTLTWPSNLEAARLVLEAVHQEGAVPALIAVWKGRLTVGLDGGDVEGFTRNRTAGRVSRRDLPAAVVKGQTAGTTVSATMAIAARAGIRFIATGAIGTARSSAHDHARVWNISSDLVELAQTPVAVVCAGARSASRQTYATEVLDTFRVPVVGYRTDTFPLYYMDIGNDPVSSRVDSPGEAARFLDVHWGLAGAGVVLAQTTPADVALSPDELVPALRSVEDQAEKDGVAPQDFSPFMMERLNSLTRGKALRAYLAILAANARLAAQVARESQRS